MKEMKIFEVLISRCKYLHSVGSSANHLFGIYIALDINPCR